MYNGYPLELIPLVRCPHDEGPLQVPHVSSRRIMDGSVRCGSCGSEFPIEQGILRMLDTSSLDSHSSTERLCRDRQAGDGIPAEMTAWDRMEIDPTLDASEPLGGARVLELGAGAGRHTMPMARRGASILAVDFSAASLHQLSGRIQSHQQIGLVQADCTELVVEPRAFDLVASTLMSNLPTPRHRDAVMDLAARACRPDGRFVFGTHHYGVRSMLTRTPRSGNYPGAPIFRYLFTRSEILSETRRYFGDVSCHPIQVRFPFAARIGLPIFTLSRLAERMPLVNELGELLLVVARKPIAQSPAQEGGDSIARAAAGAFSCSEHGLSERIGRWSRRLHLRRHPFAQGG